MTGTILIAAGVRAFRDACAYVQLDDVSFADRPAVLVARTRIRGIRHVPGGATTAVPFVIVVGQDWAPDPTADYAVRAWVDLDGDGRLGRGDLRSDQSYRVLTRGFGDVVAVEVHP